MIQVTKEQFDKLDNANLIDYSRYNRNFTIVNKNKKGNRKKYYVVESRRILTFLKEEAKKEGSI